MSRDSSLLYGGGEFPSAESELGRLVAAVCDGTITDADQARLDRLLDDSASRRAYVALMRLHGELLWKWRKPATLAFPQDGAGRSAAQARRHAGHSRACGSAGEEHGLPGRRGAAFAALRDAMRAWGRLAWKMIRRPEAIAIISAAIIVSAGLTGAYYSRIQSFSDGGFGGKTAREPLVAQISGMHHVEWVDPRREPSSLWLKEGSTIEIESGLLELTHTCGAKVLVEGPASIQVLGAAATRLVRGTVSARYERKPDGLPGGARPTRQAFVVRTPGASIVDLGTEFGVNVDEAGATKVHVFEGLVEIEPQGRPAERPLKRLGAGDAAAIDTAGDISLGDMPAARRAKRKFPGVEPPPEWVEEEAVTLVADGFTSNGPLLGAASPAARGGVGDTAWVSGDEVWMLDRGRLRSTGMGTAVLPVPIEAGAVYRLSAEFDLPEGDPGWVALGFVHRGARWDWYALQGQRGFSTSSNFWDGNFACGGPQFNNQIASIDKQFGRHVRMVQLDTRGPAWKAKFYVDGDQVAWFTFARGALPVNGIFLLANKAPTASVDNLRLAVYRPVKRTAAAAAK